jgi:transketolase
MLLYALLHLTGFHDMTRTELEHFRQLGSRTPGHPERGHTQGVETRPCAASGFGRRTRRRD